MDEFAYDVPELSCQHCVNAVSNELAQVPGVERVAVDLGTKFAVYGKGLADGWLRTAIANAGYEAR